jgi:flagellar assembly protein FliH
MAKTVFHANEVIKNSGLVTLKLAHPFAPFPVEEPAELKLETIPEFYGPTAEDLRREAELFRSNWETEKTRMIADAKAEVENIRNKAQEEAASESEVLKQEAEKVLADAHAKVETIAGDAKKKADALVKDAQAKQKDLKSAAQTEGFEEGKQAGFEEGKEESRRLLERLHTILEKIFDKRDEILAETEQQVVDLALLMTRKVVKVISETQEDVVKANVLEALRKVKSRGDVTVRVNLADVKLTTEHAKDFIQAVENIQHITVLEDTAIDQGGCVVETDFGAIDARIASQLAELEKKIREVSPVKTIPKR